MVAATKGCRMSFKPTSKGSGMSTRSYKLKRHEFSGDGDCKEIESSDGLSLKQVKAFLLHVDVLDRYLYSVVTVDKLCGVSYDIASCNGDEWLYEIECNEFSNS